MESRRTAAARAIAGILVVTGVVVLVVGLITPVTFGWFAYQPLADATSTPGREWRVSLASGREADAAHVR